MAAVACAVAIPALPQPQLQINGVGQAQPVNGQQELSATPEQDMKGSNSYGYGYYGSYGGYAGYGAYGRHYGYGAYPYSPYYYSSYGYPSYSRYYGGN